MDATELKNLQAPLKEKYKVQPDTAMITLKAEGNLGEGISCKIETGKALVEAGLHPATGGDGMLACSGDMLLEALVACAGVTLTAVATAIGVDIKGGFYLDTDANEEQMASLAKLTERYCVVYQTITGGTPIDTSYNLQ